MHDKETKEFEEVLRKGILAAALMDPRSVAANDAEIPALKKRAQGVCFVLDFRRILADYNRSVLEAKSPAARGKLAAPAFYAILEAARLHGIQPLGAESLGEQGTKERKEA